MSKSPDRFMKLLPPQLTDEGAWISSGNPRSIVLQVSGDSDMNDMGRLVAWLRLAGANVEANQNNETYSISITERV